MTTKCGGSLYYSNYDPVIIYIHVAKFVRSVSSAHWEIAHIVTTQLLGRCTGSPAAKLYLAETVLEPFTCRYCFQAFLGWNEVNILPCKAPRIVGKCINILCIRCYYDVYMGCIPNFFSDFTLIFTNFKISSNSSPGYIFVGVPAVISNLVFWWRVRVVIKNLIQNANYIFIRSLTSNQTGFVRSITRKYVVRHLLLVFWC